MVNYLPFNKFLNTVVSYQNHIFIKHYTVYRGCLSQQYWLSNNCSLMKSLKMGQSFNFANKYNFYMFLFINLIYTSYVNMVLEQASQSKKNTKQPNILLQNSNLSNSPSSWHHAILHYDVTGMTTFYILIFKIISIISSALILGTRNA